MSVTLTEVFAFIGGPVGLGVGVFLRDYLKRRQEAAIADATAARATNTDATAALVAELKAQNSASEKRAEQAATGRAEVASALTAAAHAQEGVTRELHDLAANVRAGSESLSARIDDLTDTVDERLTRIEALLAGRSPS